MIEPGLESRSPDSKLSVPKLIVSQPCVVSSFWRTKTQNSETKLNIKLKNKRKSRTVIKNLINYTYIYNFSSLLHFMDAFRNTGMIMKGESKSQMESRDN